jgi:hypothetical protein
MDLAALGAMETAGVVVVVVIPQYYYKNRGLGSGAAG